jgi:hypothetical protein
MAASSDHESPHNAARSGLLLDVQTPLTYSKPLQKLNKQLKFSHFT